MNTSNRFSKGTLAHSVPEAQAHLSALSSTQAQAQQGQSVRVAYQDKLIDPVSLFIYASVPNILTAKDGTVLFQKPRRPVGTNGVAGDRKSPRFSSVGPGPPTAETTALLKAMTTTFPKSSSSSESFETSPSEAIASPTAVAPVKVESMEKHLHSNSDDNKMTSAGSSSLPVTEVAGSDGTNGDEPSASRRLVLRDLCSKNGLHVSNRTKQDLIQQLVTFYTLNRNNNITAFLEDMEGKYDTEEMKRAVTMATKEQEEAEKLLLREKEGINSQSSKPDALTFDCKTLSLRTSFLALFHSAKKFGVAPTAETFQFHNILYKRSDIESKLSMRLTSDNTATNNFELDFLPSLCDYHLEEIYCNDGNKDEQATHVFYKKCQRKRPSPLSTVSTLSAAAMAGEKESDEASLDMNTFQTSFKIHRGLHQTSAHNNGGDNTSLDDKHLVEATSFCTNLLLSAKEMERLGLDTSGAMIHLLRQKAYQTMKQALRM